MKKIIKVFFMLIGMSVVYGQNSSYSQDSSASSNDLYNNYGQQNQNSMQGQDQNMTSSDVSHLSLKEQQFAHKLSDMHQAIFCRHFSVSQRIEAMTLADSSSQGLNGTETKISPDQAVEMVIKNARQDQNSNGGQNNQNKVNPNSALGNAKSSLSK